MKFNLVIIFMSLNLYSRLLSAVRDKKIYFTIIYFLWIPPLKLDFKSCSPTWWMIRQQKKKSIILTYGSISDVSVVALA